MSENYAFADVTLHATLAPMRVLSTFLLFVFLCQAASATTVTVPGKGCPWLAAADSNASGPGGYDLIPDEMPAGVAANPGDVLSFTVTGGTNNGNDINNLVGADGVQGNDISQASLNGISGVTAVPVSALVGVFLAAGTPSATDPYPDILDFSDTAKDYTTLAPALRQVFFIGDGRTSGGAVQHVTVPAGASLLWLGTMDGFGWYNNVGSLSVTVNKGTSTPPSLSFSATGPASDGAPIHFTATVETGWTVRVQKATVASPTEADWSDLPDGNNAHMTETPPGSGSFVLDSAAYPAGTGIAFRAIASKTGETDIISAPLTGYSLHQAALSIAASLTSTSDFTNGRTAYIDDYLIYKLTFKNSGDAPAKALQVTAKVPNFLSADIPLMVQTVAGSKVVTLASGNTSTLSLGGTFTTGPGLGGNVIGNTDGSKTYIPTDASITAITDATHFTISKAAGFSSGTKTVSTLVQYASRSVQFAQSDISLSPGGTFDSSGGPDQLKMVWNVGDLPGKAGFIYSQYVTFVVHLTGKVRVDQDIGINSGYSVASTSTPPQPGALSSGDTSHSPPVSCRVNGNISFLLNPMATTVAPGGYLIYVFSLTNRGTTAATNPVAVVDVPQNTRFALTYANGAKSVAYVGTGTFTYKLIYPTATLGQVVVKLPSIPAKTTVQLKVTFQAKWANPTDVPTINSLDYAAAFLDPAQPKPTSAVTAFNTLFTAASFNPYAPSSTDFFALISDPTNKIARSANQSGLVKVNVSGPLDNAPNLNVFKILSDTLTKTEDDGTGNRIDVVKPGEKLNFILGVMNNGQTAADEVYVQDQMPDNTTFASAVFTGPSTPSKTKSTLVVTQDPDHHHLIFSGMHLEPNDSVSILLTVTVSPSITVPPVTDPPKYIEIGECSVGSGSTNSSPAGILATQLIKLLGNAKYAQPRLLPLVAVPTASTNVAATKATLDSLYAKTPSAVPLTSAKDLLSYIPGVERFYVHYENIGSGAATGFKLTVPVPANTAFYRASWMTLGANASPGGIPTLPGTVAKPPAGGSITQPSVLATSGNVVFNLPTLAAAGKGDVMIEVIVPPSAIKSTGSSIGSSSQTISIDDAVGNFSDLSLKEMHVLGTDIAATALPAHASRQPSVTTLNSTNSVPSLGFMRYVSKSHVVPGEQFTITLVAFNFGETSTKPSVGFTIPANCTFVSADVGGSQLIAPNDNNPGSFVSAVLGSNNGPVPTDADSLYPHSAGAMTLTLQATGAAGSKISDFTSQATAPYHVPMLADPAYIQIVAPGSAILKQSQSALQVYGHSFSFLTNGTALVDLGSGSSITQGDSSLISLGNGVIISQNDSNIIATSDPKLIAVQSPLPGGGLVSLSDLIANNGYRITSGRLGNQLIIGENALIAPSAANIVAQGGGNLITPNGSNILAQGGGNIVAQGGGNIVAQGGGNLITPNGSNIVAQGGGNIVAQGGGNAIATGGGAIVAQGGGNIVAQGGGNIVAQGGGNIVAQGGGNFVGH